MPFSSKETFTLKNILSIIEQAATETRGLKPDEKARVISGAGEQRDAVIAILRDGTEVEQRDGLKTYFEERQADEQRATADAEARSAIAANPVGVPTGARQIRAGDLLASEARSITGAAGMGAAFTPAENANFYVDFLAKQSVIFKSGVTVIRTTGDAIVIPHMLTDGTAGAIAETAPLPLSEPTAESLTAVPRKFAQAAKVGNETISDAKPSVLDGLAKSLMRSAGLAYDLSAFEGSGTAPNVRGLKNVSGIGSVSMGANGAALTNLDPIADALGALSEANADDESAVIVMAPRTWKSIMRLKEATGSNKSLIQDSAGSASNGVTRSLFGRPVYLSGNLSVAETQGTSSLASSIYCYVPSEVYAILREDAVFTVNPWIYGDTDQTLVTAKLRADLLVPNPLAVVRIAGVL